MDDRIKKSFIFFAIILVCINAFVTHLSASGVMVDPEGNSLNFVVNVNSAYDENNISGDINNVDIGDVNSLGATFSKTTTAPDNPLGMASFFWNNFTNVFGVLYNVLFETQVYLYYIFSSFGAAPIGFVIVSVITVIELFGLLVLSMDILSVFAGALKFF